MWGHRRWGHATGISCILIDCITANCITIKGLGASAFVGLTFLMADCDSVPLCKSFLHRIPHRQKVPGLGSDWSWWVRGRHQSERHVQTGKILRRHQDTEQRVLRLGIPGMWILRCLYVWLFACGLQFFPRCSVVRPASLSQHFYSLLLLHWCCYYTASDITFSTSLAQRLLKMLPNQTVYSSFFLLQSLLQRAVFFPVFCSTYSYIWSQTSLKHRIYNVCTCPHGIQ